MRAERLAVPDGFGGEKPAAQDLGDILLQYRLDALLALPELWGVLAHAFGSDSLRAVHGMRITYSYLTGQPLDWLASLLWARDVLRPSQAQILHHEINNPIGPMLLLLALVPWRRARALAVGLGASAAAALLFSVNAHPISDAMLLLLLGIYALASWALVQVLRRRTVMVPEKDPA